MSRVVVFCANAGFIGSDTMEGFIYPDDTTDEELAEAAWQFGINWAESYGVYPMDCKPDDYDEEEDGGDEYSDNIEGWWEEYNPEKHDGHLIYGSDDKPSFTDNTK